MTYWFFDLIILALLAFATWRGCRRGFILALCSLLAVFVAFIGAAFVSNLLAQPMSRLIQPALEHSIAQVLEEQVDRVGQQPPDLSLPASSSGEGEEEAYDWLAQLPVDEVLSALQESGLYKGLVKPIQEAVHGGVMEITGSAAQAVARYLALELARLLLFLISFGVILILWLLLSHALDLAFRLPGLSALNQTLGGLFGLLKGALIVFIAVWLLRGSLISREAVDGTLLLRFFATNSPLSLLAKLL